MSDKFQSKRSFAVVEFPGQPNQTIVAVFSRFSSARAWFDKQYTAQDVADLDPDIMLILPNGDLTTEF